ncbi:MAG: glycosyltransferase family 2 protein [Ignavibacteriae bacterium]|nr:glycosyltransferase family 2 protein [Ignavibacteriota bacterium]
MISSSINTEQPLVSVIIPTRNRYSLLARAIESVINQRYNNLEIIIINDASDDDTSRVVEEYRNRFKRFIYICNEKRYGGAETRNIGMRNASGKYIAFLDDDDEWLPDKVLKQVTILEDNPTVGAVSCWFNKISSRKSQRVRLISDINFSLMLWENFMGSFSFCMVRSEVVKKIELDSRLVSSQDWQFWILLSQITKIYVVEQYLVNYYEHTGTRISNSSSSKLSGLRRMYFKYRSDMNGDCRKYRLTYLILYKMFNSNYFHGNLVTYAILIIKKSILLLNNKISRFVIRKILLLNLSRILLIKYDAFLATYRFAKHL